MSGSGSGLGEFEVEVDLGDVEDLRADLFHQWACAAGFGVGAIAKGKFTKIGGVIQGREVADRADVLESQLFDGRQVAEEVQVWQGVRQVQAADLRPVGQPIQIGPHIQMNEVILEIKGRRAALAASPGQQGQNVIIDSDNFPAGCEVAVDMPVVGFEQF